MSDVKEPTGWRDIESAPKHTAVDLLGYYPGRNPKPRRIPDCKLSSSKRWSTKHRDPSGRSLLRANFTPTHWMPLPPPPGEEDLKVIPGSQPHQKAGVALVEVRGCLREIDAEIAPIVSALNLGGVATTASCSGHGNRPGNIILSDGRELIIAQDYEEARLVEGHFPNIHGAWEIHTNPEEAEWSLSERRWNIRLSERLKAAINRIESIAETHPELDLAGDLKFYREVELIGWPSSRTGEEDEPLGRLQRIGQESDQLDTSYQDAHRASVRSTIATSMKREEALQVGYARLAAAATKALKFVEAIETGGRAEGDNYVASGVAALLRSALSTQESGS